MLGVSSWAAGAEGLLDRFISPFESLLSGPECMGGDGWLGRHG
ncbi:hypothetical protein C4K35_4367 [Pseudomonas chlororaphis subsp. piscium]|nr:hypothetical protein C4K35_4367 [Pseudomonas chlororaphis subsp. piscium]AZC58382.1 hypothetical protein C4K34_4225 [Pseudomonas chlororaphis subsp. piscium]AZC70836.1 hypothetical protein C4K32_4182 [Pseudomonas chlororaphis subsp. piscium]AZC77074.1 hypothetical protein C4K31_4179 [Pseudomonas chlororaphis subsp. piscium]AZC83288.1 hypothetical protein C4K30_4182 [Pseudomonas chlororaphis subsp. piscium]